MNPVISNPALLVPVATGTHGEPRTTMVRISLTVHKKTSLITVGDGPDLCTAVLTGVEALIDVASSASHPNDRKGVQPNMPSPGGQISGIADRELGRAGWARTGWGIPSISPRATTRCPGGKPGTLGRWLAANVAPGAARGRAAPNRRDAPPVPVCKIGDLSAPLERQVERHVTQNQMFGQLADPRPESASRSTSVGTSTTTR